jgi:hypothetical protein
MRTLELVKFCSNILDRKPGTVSDRVTALQDAGMISKGSRGRFGGADMTERDGVSAILAVALDHPRGDAVAANVARLRSLPLSDARYSPLDKVPVIDQMRAAFQFVHGLSIPPLTTLGDILDGLVRDMRSGAFDQWAADGAPNMVVEFVDGRLAVLIIDQWKTNNSAIFTFDDGTPSKAACTERVIRIRRPAFQALANALGPLTEALPPPPY